MNILLLAIAESLRTSNLSGLHESTDFLIHVIRSLHHLRLALSCGTCSHKENQLFKHSSTKQDGAGIKIEHHPGPLAPLHDTWLWIYSSILSPSRHLVESTPLPWAVADFPRSPGTLLLQENSAWTGGDVTDRRWQASPSFWPLVTASHGTDWCIQHIKTTLWKTYTEPCQKVAQETKGQKIYRKVGENVKISTMQTQEQKQVESLCMESLVG